MEYSAIIYEVLNGVATVTLNRPDQLNAWTAGMRAELLDAIDRSNADDEVRVLIFTGRGRAFCAGADLGRGGSAWSPDDRKSEEYSSRGTIGGYPRDGGAIVTLRILQSLKPVIAAINGPAVGIGAAMTLPMDMRIASQAARIGFVFARRGMTPDGASSWFLPRIVGISQALEWMTTGRIFDAKEALEHGLVSRVVSPRQLMPTALSLAREIADNTSGVSVALMRQLLWRGLGADSPWESHRLESKGFHLMGGSPDAREGVQSFLEKRAAKFPMRVSRELPEVAEPWPAKPRDVTP